MKLAYRAIGPDGKIVEGAIEATSQSEVAGHLRAHQLVPVKISSEGTKDFGDVLHFIHRVTGNDILFFTNQLASMLASGLTLSQALSILRNQVQNPILKETVSGIISTIEDGGTLSSALSKYPTIFSPVYVALIKAAESSGLLDKLLARLADNLEKQQKLQATIRSAMLYPIIVIILMIVVFFIMALVVIPQLSVIYTSMNYPVPPEMEFIIVGSQFLISFWYIALLIVIGVLYGFQRWHSSPAGKSTVDLFLLKVPVFGKLMAESMMVEFTRTFGLLVGTGTPIVEALHQSSGVVGNIHYKNAISGLAVKVEKGVSVGDAMSTNIIFPSILVEMTKVGEKTGKIDESLLKVSEYFEHEVNTMVKNLTTILEPFILIVLAVGVAILIYMVITPIYKLMNAFS